MKKAATVLASVAALAVTALAVPGSAEARTHRHWHHYALYYDLKAKSMPRRRHCGIRSITSTTST